MKKVRNPVIGIIEIGAEILSVILPIYTFLYLLFNKI